MHEWLNSYINSFNTLNKNKTLELPVENIYTITFDIGTISELFAFLTQAALHHSNIYRGISHDTYGIVTSQKLYRPTMRYEDWNTHEEIDGIIQRFRDGLNQRRTEPVSFTRLQLLEYARHFGVPTPIVDFSYSPFVALFFAFCEPRSKEIYCYPEGDTKYALLNIIDKDRLTFGYLNTLGKDCNMGSEDRIKFEGYDPSFCSETFEHNTLQIINAPSVFNTRMKNQQGLFLYDTLNYGSISSDRNWGDSFEDMIQKLPNPRTVLPGDFETGTPPTETFMPIMIRVRIDIKMTGEILTMLDRMNINAFTIYPDDNGAAMHAKLGHHFHSSRHVNVI